MHKALKPHVDILKSYDSTWAGLEWNYLENHVEELVKAKCHKVVLEAFLNPPTKVAPRWEDVLDTIDRVKAGPECNALPLAFTQQMTSLYAMVRNLQAGVPPERRDIQNFSAFNMAVLKASEVFCTYKTEIPSRRKGGTISVEILYGKPALLHRFSDFQKTAAKGAQRDLNEFQDFRRFAWLLDQSQHDVVDKWVADAVHSRRQPEALKAIRDGDVKAVGVSSSSKSAPIARSGSMAAEVPPVFTSTAGSSGTKAARSKADQKADNDRKARLAAMQVLFGSKALVR